ncbi:MAG: hypothetical protein KTR20_13000 [Cellvibrionaceae bacterium]|nr:hypothetical protein [Cellvibrionaceae bacterium]
MMNWFLINKTTLVDLYSGYAIYLEAGSWQAPEQVRPSSPEDFTINEEVKYLRLGLAYASSEFKMKKAS